MTTRAELEKENADLRARLAKYEGAPAPVGPVSFGMSEGVRNDIEQATAIVESRDADEVVVHDGGTGATHRVFRRGNDVITEVYPEGDLTTMAPTAPGRTDDLPNE